MGIYHYTYVLEYACRASCFRLKKTIMRSSIQLLLIPSNGRSIVLKVNNDKRLSVFYALDSEPQEIIENLYQAIIKLCDTQNVDLAWQLMMLMEVVEKKIFRGKSVVCAISNAMG